MLLDLARVFCQNTSIRGVGKIFKAPSACLRALWLIYVLSMFIFLVHSTSRLFKDYLEYSTVIETSRGMKEITEFPSLTFCNHYPFSKQAKEYWSKGTIMSPRKWNLKLRRRLKECISNKSISCGLDNFLYDTKRMYYQNLSPKESAMIGHHKNDSILLCVATRGQVLTAGTPVECDIEVTPISLVENFNCFTVQPRLSTNTDRLILVINVREKPDFENHEQAFIPDIFEQAHGVRIVIHEPGTYPDIQAKGDQVEPGKMVEVSYLPIRVSEVKTPKKPCYEDPSEYPVITDLGKTYQYTFDACRSMKKGMTTLRKCKCYFASCLRPGVPNITHPYCGEILKSTDENIETRKGCLGELVQSTQAPDYDVTEGCYRRCNFFRYTTRTSITKWRPTQWQVYWARQQLRSLNFLYEMNKNKSSGELESDEALKARLEIEEYVEWENLTQIKKVNSSKSSLTIPRNADDFVYIVLSRQKSPILLEVSKLTLTLNGLVSRIGGLCSLYLGLTCAFGVELIEFLYLIKQKYSQPKEKKVEQKECKKAEENHGATSKDTNTNNNNYGISDEPMMSGRYSPMYGMSSYLCDTSKSDDESPWKPRIPLNSTSL